MRILFSALQYPSDAYPFAAFISMMAKEMVKRGHSVTVICPQSITHQLIRRTPFLPEYEEFKVEGCSDVIKVYRPKSLTFGSRKYLGRLTTYINRFVASRCLKKLGCRFDVVYAHFWEAAYNVSKVAQEWKLPLNVACGEDKIILPQLLKSKEVALLNKITNNVIAVSSKNMRESVKHGLTDEVRCHVIPNGPDLRLFHQYDKDESRREFGFDKNDFIVAFVGRFIHRKGAKRVEEAVLKLNDTAVKAIFIGSTMADEDSSQDPSGNEIIFKGVMPHHNIPRLLSAADVYVLPTLAEGCSNSIVEAMACGLPIVSSDRDFNYDVLDFSNAILVNPLSIDEIAMAIKKLKDNENLRIAMSESSLAKAAELSFEKRVDKILGIVESSISSYK